MKLYYLPALIWALAMSPLFAQKQLPPSIEPYAVHWGYSLKLMLQAAGYHVPGPQPDYNLNPTLQPRSSALRLDSTLFYAGYGNSTPDSTPLFRNIHTYPQADVEVITEHFYNQDHWMVLTRTTLVQDDLGRLVDIFAQQYDEESGTYIQDSRIVLFPRGTSPELVDSFFIYAWSLELGDWVRQFSTWNEFDQEDKLVASTSSTEFFQVPLVFVDRYTYSAEGDLMVIQSYNVDNGTEIPGDRQEFAYSDHRLASVTTLVSDGAGSFFPQSKITYTYFTSEQQENVSAYEYDFASQDWKLNRVDSYQYDEEDRVSAKETVALDPAGIWVRNRDTYAYVRDTYLATEAGHLYDSDIEAWVVKDRKFYYYSDLVAVDPVEPVADALFLFPNPSSGMVQVQLSGRIIVLVYTLSGQLLHRIELPPGEKILDLSRLPSGMYQVRAKSDEDYFSGKLIIQ